MDNSIFEKDSIFKTYMKLALPVVFNLVISIIYNVADTYFIAKTNNLNLVAGVSLGAPIFMILMAFGNILGQGGSSLMSRLIGKNDYESTEKISSFCFYSAIIIGIIVGVFMVLFQKPFLHLLGANVDTYEYAWQYYIVLAIGAPLVVLTFIHSNLLRCEGLATESMVGSVSGTVLNIILDPIFIQIFHLGAFGAALATMFGYTLTNIFLLFVVKKKSKFMSVAINKAKIPSNYMTQIFGIGIPAALTNIMSSVCTILVNQYLLPYGNDKIAAMGIVLKVIMIGSLVLTGFSFGGAPLLGYFYGAKNKAKLKELFRFCYTFLIGLGLALGAILFILAPVLIKMFLSDASLLEEAVKMFRLQVLCLPFMAVVLMSTIFCQAFGKVAGSFILSLSRQGFVFIITIIIASVVLGYNGVIGAQLIADLASSAIALFVIFKMILPSINSIA